MSASNRRISDIISDVEEGKLDTRPAFQRRLIWTNKNKEDFIDTVLKGYPFPEIFVAAGELDPVAIKRKNWLVDGQQRVSTLVSYVRGSPDILCKTIQKFADLDRAEQIKFLEYEVAVRDLGAMSQTQIKEVFNRINSTDYALKSIEKLNAMYNGAYRSYCERLSSHEFFERHKIFTASNKKRMQDLGFCVILVTTLLTGYYRRDEKNKDYLDRYNDDFPQTDTIQIELDRVFDFIDRCQFGPASRVWKQTDLFTLLVELHHILIRENRELNPEVVHNEVGRFYTQVDEMFDTQNLPDDDAASGKVLRYLKASSKASNDKYARVERAEIISELLKSTLQSSLAGGALPNEGSSKK